MKVLLAQPRGFCAGVERAVAVVERALALNGGRVHVRHAIVHNERVVAGLVARGAVFVEDLAEVPDGALTVISAHGAPASVEAEAARRGLPLLDATCPLVTKVHDQARRLAAQGRTVVVVGHAAHPEVVGTLGRFEGERRVIATVAEVAALDLDPDAPTGYVTQTTLSVDDTRAVIAALRARFADLAGPDTSGICYATQNRQAAVRALAHRADRVVVVGSRRSSNTTRLAEIAAECGAKALLVEDAAEIGAEWLAGARVVGLTAGASAPESQVRDALARLRHLGAREVETLDGARENVHFRLPTELAALALPDPPRPVSSRTESSRTERRDPRRPDPRPEPRAERRGAPAGA